MDRKLIFALDIGTRSVVGLAGEKTGNTIKVLAMERQEHSTRAMLDGQIHDVPEVAQVLSAVTTRLQETVGPLKKVSVAAAGRALCTLRAEAEIDAASRGMLTADDERSLELAAIQTAQHRLATGKEVDDPTNYYCVGHSIVRFTLDGNPIKSLIGQRGKIAALEVIATFLPRQVIDSLQSAIESVGLEMGTLTLEPIAAINVLIPPTMRHLNLALVDVGAGTSDVAITKDGSVIGFGMVPCAGDEITEALSQAYLLDFNVAEILKRNLIGKQPKIAVSDVLGQTQQIDCSEIIGQIQPAVNELAQAIATQIITLNAEAPQAVLLVGGGSLTPGLPEAVANALNIPSTRVAIRQPDAVSGLEEIPPELCAPDGVTPLGILKLASSQSLNFMNVTVNNQHLHLFNLGKLTVADALLTAGIEIRSLHGRPGMGITVTVNGQKKFLPGSMGQSGCITVNDEAATFNDLLTEGDIIVIKKGTDGLSPSCILKDVVDIPTPLSVVVNGNTHSIPPTIQIDGKAAPPETLLSDRCQVLCQLPSTLREVLAHCGLSVEPRNHQYKVNGVKRSYRQWSDFILNGEKAALTDQVQENDTITVQNVPLPTFADLLGTSNEENTYCVVTFNGIQCKLPLRRHSLTVNGKPAFLTDTATPNSVIEFTTNEIQPIISDVLLASRFDPRQLGKAAAKITVLINKKPAEYITPVKNGDSIEIVTS
ncbi:MAG: ftsA 1 [Firmicutes bacterium]|nr:ftsA 1 [Bacillota bacterium]